MALVRLHQLGAVYISQGYYLVLEVMLLLKVCSSTSPFDVIAKEAYVLVIQFILGDSKEAEKLLDINSVFQFRRELRQLSKITRTLTAYTGSANEPIVAYWVMRANNEEIIKDFERIDKGIPLTDNAHGVLWVLNNAMADVKTRDKNQLQFIFNLFTSTRKMT